MNQHLVWNFEFSSNNKLALDSLFNNKSLNLKWEKRFFWPQDHIIGLCAIDDGLLKLSNYQHKYKEDYYYLLPNYNYNIKRRGEKLLYKPIIHETPSSLGFGKKINLGQKLKPLKDSLFDLQKINSLIQEKAIMILVKKEAYIYKFPTTPHIKLELAQLDVNNQLYFTACIEGKSRLLVELLSKHLVGEKSSSEYITFLKQILKL
jgi:hypothetical protein